MLLVALDARAVLCVEKIHSVVIRGAPLLTDSNSSACRVLFFGAQQRRQQTSGELHRQEVWMKHMLPSTHKTGASFR